MSGTMQGVQRPAMRLSGPTLDAADPLSLADFYHRLLGWEIVRSEGPSTGQPRVAGWALLRSPSGDRKIEIQWDPHYRQPVWPSVAGQQGMMMHLDIGVDDLVVGVEWALTHGAVLAEHQPQAGIRVLFDPEGHPFCLYPDPKLAGSMRPTSAPHS